MSNDPCPMTIMKQTFVNSIRTGDNVDDIFILSEKYLSQKRDGDTFLNVTLADKTGRIRGVIWDNVDQIAPCVNSGDFVHIVGLASEYKSTPQLVIRTMEVFSAESVNPADFIPTTPRNVDQMFERIVKLSETIRNPFLKQLLDEFWKDESFVRKFKTAPAAKKMHHAYLGGLLEHTLSMALLADRIAGHYSGIDMDLLKTGAILHDMGKIREFDFQYKIDYSTEGRLLSHLVIGCMMLDEKIALIENFPPETAMLLRHMILSHHGAREFGSPELPKTIEAVLLNYIDEIDAKVNGIREYIASQEDNSEWTPYHRILERHFYRGKDNNS